MTRLTELANHVPAPAAGDRLYIVDVSDATEGPAGTSGYTTPADLLQGTALAFASRAAAQGATIPAGVTRFLAAGLAYVEDAAGTALVTADARTWSPDRVATYEHWGAAGDNAADDTAAIRAAHDWCMKNRAELRPASRTYRVTGTIIDYDVQRDGAGLELNLIGAGPFGTLFRIDAPLADFLVKIVGDTSAYGAPHAKFWNIEDLRIESDGIVTADVFRIDCAGNCDLNNISIHNCRGRAVFAREWWDSDFNVVITRSGDDGLGANSGGDGITPVPAFVKEAIRFDYFFSDEISESACNNIYMPKSFQLESSRHVAMYWGPGTRKCTFHGKLHGYPPQYIPEPHLVLDGARQNFIIGGNITEANDIAIEIVNLRNYIPTDNVIVGNHLDAHGACTVLIDGARRTIVVGNTCLNPNAAVQVVSGQDTVVHSNTVSLGGTEVSVLDAAAMQDFAVAADLASTAPGAALVLTSANGASHRLTVNNQGVLLLDGAAV